MHKLGSLSIQSKKIIEGFENGYTIDPETGCWLWARSQNNYGYGILCLGGKSHLTHRLSYELHVGEIPDNLLVCHHCDVRNCCNPDHLFVGTNKDNMQDMLSKGRGRPPKGESHRNAKLTETAVRNMRRYYAAGAVTLKWMAQVYGMSEASIGNIVKHRSWRHVS